MEEKYKYIKPSFNLLTNINSSEENNISNNQIDENKKIIDEYFTYNKISVNVGNVYKSPATTIYELNVKPGIRIDDIVKHKDDLAFELGERNIGFLVPIPGKTNIGIEINNKEFEKVSLKETLSKISNKYKKSKLLIPLGKNVLNENEYLDLIENFNLLIVGKSQTGKTNLLNDIITTTLLRTMPDDVRLILIDPKISGFNYYEGIPNLLLPVITNIDKTRACLELLASKIDKRYSLFSRTGTKNIQAYNEYVEKITKKDDKSDLKKLPYILIVIDSFQDLLLLKDEKMNENICKLLSNGYKVGFHLVLTVDDTAEFYSNQLNLFDFISVLSFKSNNKNEKYSIKETSHLGKYGDAYIKKIYNPTITRIYTPYINDEDIKNIVDFIKENNKLNNDFDSKLLENEKNNKTKKDALYDEILEYAIRMGQISTSLIQRKYGIRYDRAARIIDDFEERGIVGPAKGSKPRDVLVKLKEVDNFVSISNNNDSNIKNNIDVDKKTKNTLLFIFLFFIISFMTSKLYASLLWIITLLFYIPSFKENYFKQMKYEIFNSIRIILIIISFLLFML